MNKIIYIADDDINVCEILNKQLSNEGYKVCVFYDGKTLLDMFIRKPCDLVITDIMMPIMNGYELCKKIREKSEIPIIMLSAKSEEIDRILGLELGSDDYISKPFSLREISIKVRNMLRRSNKNIEDNDKYLRCKDLKMDINSREIFINNQVLNATTKEFELLKLLIENRNQAFSREHIIEKIWGYDYFGEVRQVDHLIKRLRKKMLLLEAECSIETIWGYGYKVRD